MDPDLKGLLNGELAASVRRSAEFNNTFLQVVDRSWNIRALSVTDETSERVAELNTSSAVPEPRKA